MTNVFLVRKAPNLNRSANCWPVVSRGQRAWQPGGFPDVRSRENKARPVRPNRQPGGVERAAVHTCSRFSQAAIQLGVHLPSADCSLHLLTVESSIMCAKHLGSSCRRRCGSGVESREPRGFGVVLSRHGTHRGTHPARNACWRFLSLPRPIPFDRQPEYCMHVCLVSEKCPSDHIPPIHPTQRPMTPHHWLTCP